MTSSHPFIYLFQIKLGLRYTNSRPNIRNAAIDTTFVNTTTQMQSPILACVAFPSRKTNRITPKTQPTVGISDTKATITAITRRDLKSATTKDIFDAIYIQHVVINASITNAKASIPTLLLSLKLVAVNIIAKVMIFL